MSDFYKNLEEPVNFDKPYVSFTYNFTIFGEDYSIPIAIRESFVYHLLNNFKFDESNEEEKINNLLGDLIKSPDHFEKLSKLDIYEQQVIIQDLLAKITAVIEFKKKENLD